MLNQKKATEIVRSARNVCEAIDAILIGRVPPVTGSSLEQCRLLKADMEKLIGDIEKGDVPPRPRYWVGWGRTVADEWRDSPLIDEVIRIEQNYGWL